MKIIIQSLAVIYLFSIHHVALTMHNIDLKYPGYTYSVLKRPSTNTRGLVKAEKKISFLGFVWAKKTFTRETIINEDTLKATFFSRENFKTELCKKTYALLGTAFIGTCIGTAYYFDWFKKK